MSVQRDNRGNERKPGPAAGRIMDLIAGEAVVKSRRLWHVEDDRLHKSAPDDEAARRGTLGLGASERVLKELKDYDVAPPGDRTSRTQGPAADPGTLGADGTTAYPDSGTQAAALSLAEHAAELASPGEDSVDALKALGLGHQLLLESFRAAQGREPTPEDDAYWSAYRELVLAFIHEAKKQVKEEEEE